MAKPVTKTVDNLSDKQEALLEWKGKGFDLRTRVIDPKTGKVIRWQPYSLVINKDNAEDYYIRDGKRFNRNGVELNPQPQQAIAKK